MSKLTFAKYCEKNHLSTKSSEAKKLHQAYLEQHELDLENNGKAEVKRGGYRPNAGRKAERGETVVMRIPVAYKAAIQQLIAHLDESKMVSESYGQVSSDSLFMRTLFGKPVELIFTTKPVTKS